MGDERLSDFFPPAWVMGQRWSIEYFFEQRIEALTGDAISAIPDNFDKQRELWDYEVYGRELINGAQHIVVKAEPRYPLESCRKDTFQIYFDEQTLSLHSFKRKEEALVATPRIEYVKNPFGKQSFFIAENHHLIFDWPTFENGQLSNSIGTGKFAFAQKCFMDRVGLNIELSTTESDTLQTWQKGTPWWSFADKIIHVIGREMHVQGKLVTEHASPSDEE